MKKSILALSLLAYVFVSTSCNQSSNSEPQAPIVDSVVAKAPEAPAPSSNPEDIKLNDLKSPCDYVDAMQKLIVAIDEVKGDLSASDLENTPEQTRILRLVRKMTKISDAGDKKYTEEELKECPNYAAVIGKAHIMEKEWEEELNNSKDEEMEDSEL
jgi:hypothetical protein